MHNNLLTADALQANVGWVRSQTAYVEAGVYRARFPEIRYPGLIPVDYSAPEWTPTIVYTSMDVAGRAKWIADRSSDIPVVGHAQEEAQTQIHMAGIGYDYGLEEVMRAQSLGQNLPGEKAQTARLVYERTVDNILFTGDVEKGWKGLINSTAVTAISAANGDWNNIATTEDEMLADVNEVLTGIWTSTNEIAMGDTLLLPTTKFQKLASTRLGDTGTTVLEFLQKANIFTAETGRRLNIRGVRSLIGAGAGVTDRMVAYRNSSDVLKAHIPMRHRFLPMQTTGLLYQIPGIFRLGPLDIRLPKEVRYSDGI